MKATIYNPDGSTTVYEKGVLDVKDLYLKAEGMVLHVVYDTPDKNLTVSNFPMIISNA